MIVIADSGSTKTDWCIGNSQTDYRIVQTPGINPFYLSTKEISRQITENLFPQLTEKDTVTELYFYGAGCTPEKACIVADALTECFPHAHVAVESDLSGAARALCGHTKGIACILGTGSNSCEYDGEKLFPMFLHWGTYWGTKEAEPCWVNAWWVTASKNSSPRLVRTAAERI